MVHRLTYQANSIPPCVGTGRPHASNYTGAHLLQYVAAQELSSAQERILSMVMRCCGHLLIVHHQLQVTLNYFPVPAAASHVSNTCWLRLQAPRPVSFTACP